MENVLPAVIYSIVFIALYAWSLALYTLLEMVVEKNVLVTQMLWALELTLIGVCIVVYYVVRS